MERDEVETDDTSICEDFNSHAHVERDRVMRTSRQQTAYFNSHAHVERDSCYIVNAHIIKISTHTLTWSVTKVVGSNPAPATNFNSHAHVERDELSLLPCLAALRFQLTRSRGA